MVFVLIRCGVCCVLFVLGSRLSVILGSLSFVLGIVSW